jgi:CheY-like chemotaxis protein
MTQPSCEILLIDDSADDRQLFIAALRATGMEATVTEASDAVEAVIRLNAGAREGRRRLPSLVVLDLGLGGLQGATLLQVMRNAYTPRELPVIVLTGSTNPADRELCEAWGIIDYITKPQTQQQLRTLVLSLDLTLKAIAAGSISADDKSGISSAQRYAVKPPTPPAQR